MDDLIVVLIVPLLLAAAFAVAKWTDIYWRIKLLRRWTKKDYHIAEILSKDKKTKTQKIFLPEQSTMWIDGKVWTIEKNRIYRTDKPEDGFVMAEEFVKWREGIPVIHIDEDSFRPLDFDFSKPTNVKAGEAGAILKSWVVNQAAKAIINAYEDMKKQQVLIYIILGACLLCLLASGLTFMAVGDIQKELNQMNSTLNETHYYVVPASVKLANISKYGG